MQKIENRTKSNMGWVNTNEKCFDFVVADEIMNLFARSIFTACKRPKTEKSTKVNMCWVNTNEKMFWFCCHRWNNECFWCLMIWRNLKNVLWQLNLPGLPTPGLGELNLKNIYISQKWKQESVSFTQLVFSFQSGLLVFQISEGES